MSAQAEKQALVESILRNAEQLLQAQRAAEAVGLLEALLAEVPECAPAWLMLGQVALQRGDATAALPLLERACSLQGDMPQAQLLLCHAEYATGRLQAAAQRCVTLEAMGLAPAALLPAEMLARLRPQDDLLIPDAVLRQYRIRGFYQEVILLAVLADLQGWWTWPELRSLFECRAPEAMRTTLRSIVLEGVGDAAAFVRLSTELDTLGIAAADVDRAAVLEARAWIAEQLRAGQPGQRWPGRVRAPEAAGVYAMMNGLLALHAAETHPAARGLAMRLRSMAEQVWLSGRAAVSPGDNPGQIRQVARMLWHFGLLDAAASVLQQHRADHFLPGVIAQWQRDAAANRAWAGAQQAQGGFAHVIGATVWGDDYLDFFLDCHLASLLAPGNLPALARHGRVLVSVVTNAAGRERIEASAQRARLRAHAELHVTCIDRLPSRAEEGGQHFYMHYGLLDHHHVLLAQSLAATLVLLPVDTVVSSCTLSALQARLAEGYDVCTMAGIEAYRGEVMPQLQARLQDGVLDIAADALAAQAFAHKTEYCRSLIMSPANRLNAYPREFFWRVPGGYMCHSIFMHPVMLAPRILQRDAVLNHENTDWALLPRLLQADGRAAVIEDAGTAFIMHCSEDNARAHEMSEYTGTLDAELGSYLLGVHEHDYPVHRDFLRMGTFFPVADDAVPLSGSYRRDITRLRAIFAMTLPLREQLP